MSRSNGRYLVFLIMLLLPMLANAQYDYFPYVGINPTYLEFNNIGGGARAAGMGGAYLGIAGGEMAYSWNPAAMIYSDKAKLGVQFVSVADEFSDTMIDFYPFMGTDIQPRTTKRDHFSLNFGGFAAPFTLIDREWAIGGGYRNVYDMVFEYNSPGLLSSRNIFVQDRGVDAASIAMANKVIEGIGVGFTFNSYIRNSEFNLYDGLATAGISGGGQDTVIYDVQNNRNSHFSGFNFDLGISGDFSMFRAGIVIHTPYELKQDAKQTLLLIIPPVPAGWVDRITYTYSMPLSYSLGIGVLPVENFALTFDFDSRPLSKIEIHTNWEQPYEPDFFPYRDSTFNPEWEDINQFRVGAEYVMDAGFADIPLRAGFRNEPSTTKEITSLTYDSTNFTWTDELGDQISTNIFALGTGLHLERIWFDVAYQFGSSSYDRVVDLTAPQTIEIKRDYSRLFISAGMYF